MVNELKSLKNEFKKCQNIEHQINNKMNDLKGENDKITSQINRIDRDINNLYISQNSSLCPDTAKLLDLIHNIRFNNNKYYSPICRYISCRNNQDANIIKEVLNYYLLNGSLFLNDDDGYKVRNLVRSKSLKRANVYTFTHHVPLQTINIEPLKQFHIVNTVDGLMQFDEEDTELREFLATNSYTNVILVSDHGFNEKIFERYLLSLPQPSSFQQQQQQQQLELNMMKIIVVFTPTHRFQYNRIRGGRFACSSSVRRTMNHNLIIPNLLDTRVYYIYYLLLNRKDYLIIEEV